jgi:hypothetical protein
VILLLFFQTRQQTQRNKKRNKSSEESPHSRPNPETIDVTQIMATDVTQFTIVFPAWYDERAEAETLAKGYLPDVEVHLAGGKRYRLYFIDPIRLQQTLEDDTREGRPYFGEPGLVVVPNVTTEAVRTAVAGLFRDGYFRQLRAIENGA